MITIEPVKSEIGFQQCQDILIKVWDLANGGERNIIPTRILQISHHYGGVVLAAHSAEGEIIGFAWAFPAMDADGKPFLFSDTLAVLPQYRDQGIGARLKFAQREWAMRHNLETIRWTYDPLEARNGYLNIARLGGLARTYKCNAYGVGTTGPNKGLETDRVTIDWHLNTPRVQECALGKRPADQPPELPSCIEIGSGNGEIVPRHIELGFKEPELLVPLPLNFQRLKGQDIGLAKRWRLAIREVCEAYFAQGYAIVDFHMKKYGQERQGYYRLSRNWLAVTHTAGNRDHSSLEVTALRP
jgi:predicted GNAT superfamily acetyltransferase